MRLRLPHPRTPARWVILMGTTFIMVTATGVILGWAAVVLMLNGEGEFAPMCRQPSAAGSGTGPAVDSGGSASGGGGGPVVHPTTGSTTAASGSSALEHVLHCDESDLQLNLIFTACAVAYSVSSVILGAFVDKVGPRVGASSMLATVAVGSYLVSFSAYPSRNWFFPGFVTMAAAGTPLQLSLFHVANLFPTRVGVVTSFLSGLFGVSSLVFVILYEVWLIGFSRHTVFLGYAVVLTCCLLITMLLPNRPFELGDTVEWSVKHGGFKIAHTAAEDAGVVTVPAAAIPQQQVVHHGFDDVGSGLEMGAMTGAGSGTLNRVASENDLTPILSPSARSDMGQVNAGPTELIAGPVHADMPTVVGVNPAGRRAPRTLRGQLCSVEFVAFAVYQFLVFFRYNMYLGSVNLQLMELFPDQPADVIDRQTNLFAWIAPFGAAATPALGLAIDRWGIALALGIVSLLACLHTFVAMIPSLQAQLITFICYTVGQETLFAAWYSFAGSWFGFQHVGTLSGIVFALLGISSAMVYPVTTVAVTLDRGFFWQNVVELCVGLVSFTVPILFAVRGHTRIPLHVPTALRWCCRPAPFIPASGRK